MSRGAGDGGLEDRLHGIFASAFRRRKGLSGPGDDTARVQAPPGRALHLSTDQVVEGIHAEEGTPPAALARKLVRRSLSDLAAAGARPWACLWSAALPRTREASWVRRLARAVLAEADRFGMAVIGGDLSAAPACVLTCTVLGLEGRRRPPGRSGARPGDWICVTGRLGGAVRSGRHLLPEPRLSEGRTLVERFELHALLDLSDGLDRDLRRLLRASKAGACVELESLPLARGLAHGDEGWASALLEGEDYELLACLPADQARRAFEDPLLRRSGFHVIGEVDRERRLRYTAFGEPWTPPGPGWSHGLGEGGGT